MLYPLTGFVKNNYFFPVLGGIFLGVMVSVLPSEYFMPFIMVFAGFLFSATLVFISANILIGLLVVSELGIYSNFIGQVEHMFYPLFNIRFLLLLVVSLYAYGVVYFSMTNKEEGSEDVNG